MNTALHAYQAQYIEKAAQLPGYDSLPIRLARHESMQRCMQMGLPTQKLESWKYTSTKVLCQTVHPLYSHGCVGLDPEDLTPYLVNRQSTHRLVFVNGLLSRPLSDLHDLPVGVQVESMAKIANESPSTLEPYLGNYLAGTDQGFAEVNHALWLDGAFVHVPPGIQLNKPLQLLFLTTPFHEPIVTLPWNVIVAGNDSLALVIESYATIGHSSHFTNAYTTLVLGERAKLGHLLLLAESHRANHVGVVQTTQMNGSHLDSKIFSIGGEMTRQEVHVTLAGEDAECTQEGLFLAGGRQHMDFHTLIHHISPHSQSRQLFKGILDAHARGVFNGVVRVPPGLHHIRTQQQTANLLLSDTAEIDAKPQLEIHSDAVQCNHGATVGSLDPEALFYLRSRGLDAEAARILLVQGFADELLQRVKPAVVQEWIEQSLNQNWRSP